MGLDVFGEPGAWKDTLPVLEEAQSYMRPEHLVALQNVCRSQEDLQKVWDNPAIFNFNHKHVVYVTMCVAEDGPDLKWVAAVRLVNTVKRNFRSPALWKIQEKLKARSILFDQLDGVGLLIGEEEIIRSKAMQLIRKLTPEERSIVLAPQLLGN